MSARKSPRPAEKRDVSPKSQASKKKMLANRSDHTAKVVSRFFGAIGAPDAAALAATAQWAPLMSIPAPSILENDADFRRLYQVHNLMRKFEVDIGVDRVTPALTKFMAAERQCEAINVSLLPCLADPNRAPLVLQRARVKIRKILGRFLWEAASSHCGFGPGATCSQPRTRGDAYWKIGDQPDCTSNVRILAEAVIRYRYPEWWTYMVSRWGDDPVRYVPGNRVTTVPKDAKIDRVIAAEPVINSFLQKGIGGLLRSRLASVGIQLRTQQPHNQRLAMEGSITGNLATIDLSSASDSIAHALVSYLLPPDWLEAIELTRSPRGILPDRSLINYEKVSSMGNGYTFELETLIFWALCHASSHVELRENVNFAVYGDDIIVPAETAPSVLRALDLCGFMPNLSKTFVEGPFRESCGKHWYRGEDVTPIYVKEKIAGPCRLFWFHNQVQRYAHRWSLTCSDPISPLRPVCDYIKRLVHPRIRFKIPEGTGDGGFVTDWDEAMPPIHWQQLPPPGWRCPDAMIRYFVPYQCWSYPYARQDSKVIELEEWEHALTLKWLMQRPRKLDLGEQVSVHPRDAAAIRVSIARGYTTQWHNYGLW